MTEPHDQADARPHRTPLYDMHLAAGARMMPFGGFEMPLQYTGIVAEHNATRTTATLFDTCHMGEIRVQGQHAARDLDRLVSSNVATMRIGQCRYGLMCATDGGVIDDLIVYRLGEGEFFLVVNAGTRRADFEWICDHLSHGNTACDESDGTAKIDLQGPGSPAIMQKLSTTTLSDLRYFYWGRIQYRDRECLVSRTGYTGEMGFEFYSDADTAIQFWKDCVELGASPAGLGARDTLRLEMGLPLYGHELRPDRNAADSGLDFAISRDKSFLGSDVVLDSSRHTMTLTGFLLQGRRAAREGDRILGSDGTPLGTVTSGSFAPSLGTAIAMGYVARDTIVPGQTVQLLGARGAVAATVTPPPFYRTGTARQPITDFLT